MRAFKIAPGKNARFWENNDCLYNRHICVGWRKVQNLKKYRSEAELCEAVNQKHYRGRAAGTAASVGKQLWTLRNLRVGDKVIANKGNSVVLRIGTVNGRYKWEPSREHYPHTVPVDWGTPCRRRKIPVQKEWNNNTVKEVSPKLFALIARKLRVKVSIEAAAGGPTTNEELNISGPLDVEAVTLSRKEQQRLRTLLLKSKTQACCFLCSEELPAQLLVAAHLKTRAKCADSEKRDLKNVVLMCLLGCDALFERGLVTVVNGKVSSHTKGIPSPRLRELLRGLRGRSVAGEGRQHYLNWHATHHR